MKPEHESRLKACADEMDELAKRTPITSPRFNWWAEQHRAENDDQAVYTLTHPGTDWLDITSKIGVVVAVLLLVFMILG